MTFSSNLVSNHSLLLRVCGTLVPAVVHLQRTIDERQEPKLRRVLEVFAVKVRPNHTQAQGAEDAACHGVL